MLCRDVRRELGLDFVEIDENMETPEAELEIDQSELFLSMKGGFAPLFLSNIGA
jgi:hypothetical protein